MKQPQKFSLMAKISVSIASFFYIVIVCILVLLYNNNENGVETNILFNLDKESIWYYICTILISLMCVFSFPCCLMPAIQIIEPHSRNDDNGLFTNDYRKILIRLGSIIIILILSMLFPNFNIVMAFDIFLLFMIIS